MNDLPLTQGADDGTAPVSAAVAASSSLAGKSFLFVGGCARSGTTALAQALNAHEDVFIGDERLAKRFHHREVELADFERESFLSHDEPLMHSQRGIEKDAPEEAYDRAKVLGDKLPTLHLAYPFAETFPGCRFLYILRNPLSVAESFNARAEDETDLAWRVKRKANRALKEWNTSVREATNAIDAGLPLTVVAYERFFASVDSVVALISRLNLPLAGLDMAKIEALIARYKEKIAGGSRPLDEELRSYVMMQMAFRPYRRLHSEHCVLRPET